MARPLDIKCPKCAAFIDQLCVELIRGRYREVDTHPERKAAAVGARVIKAVR